MKEWILGLVGALALGSCLAAVTAAENVGPYELMPRDAEIALARTAGLAPWSERASVYVLERRGYVKAVEGTNGFTCLVGRDEPGTSWPICFDAEGTETILPRVLREAELRLEGKSREEVREDTARRFLSGAYRAPARPGIAYMLSGEAVTSNGKNLVLAPPHLMIYAPNVKGDEIGAVPGEAHSPMVLSPGDPHAYIIVFVRDSAPEFTRVEGGGR